MSAAERPIPTQDNELPPRELGPEVEDLIFSFRRELSNLPEFQKSLAEIYFNHSGFRDSDSVGFRLGENYFTVSYDSGPYKPSSTPILDIDMERFTVSIESANREVLTKKAILELKKSNEWVLGEAEYVTTDAEGNIDWEEHHNKKSAIEGARGILKEIRDYKR